MKKILPLIFIALVLLGGCINRPIELDSSDIQRQNLSAWEDFSIQSNIAFSKKFVRDDGSIAWINYDHTTARRQPQDVIMEEYLLTTSCSPALTGTSETTNLFSAGGKTSWGRIDFFDHGMDFAPAPEPICRPAGGHTGEGYVLCSEKNGKAAVICVSTQIENSTLAKQIFETFKWTK